MENKTGLIRVGTIHFASTGGKIYPAYPNFELIEVMTASTKYGSLGPYQLKTPKGYIMENVWQFSKIYPSVPATVQKRSRWDKTVIWQWPEEKHVDSQQQVLPEYFTWRWAGYKAKDAIRYPVGYDMKARSTALCSLWDPDLSPDENICPLNPKCLTYIEARKAIYLPLYSSLARKGKQYKELEEKLMAGTNLLIAEVDGPQEESMPYYKEKYGVADNWIENRTVEMNEKTFRILLNDARHPFGHGYCLARSLLDPKDKWSSSNVDQ